jgi:hypothetical protein
LVDVDFGDGSVGRVVGVGLHELFDAEGDCGNADGCAG